MEYIIAKQTAAQLDKEYSEASAALKSIPGINSGAMGLTPEHVRITVEYKVAHNKYKHAFEALRNFNAIYCKQYRKELAAERKLKRGA